MNLLPKHYDEFHTKEYWNHFFQERNQTFEWYGSFKNFANLCFRNIRLIEKCLVIGCGNSAFSSDLYDHGFKKINNIDFSEQVITSMRQQNLQRTEMIWEVMDMTSLTYESESFDVVLDKGALDALMSADTIEAKSQASNMFQSINNVLKSNGRYICITLAEDFIVEHLLGFFTSTYPYLIQIHTIQTDSPSPFKTFVIIITKQSTTQPIQIYFDTFGSPLPNHQFKSLSLKDTLEMLYQVQSFSQKRFDMSIVKPNDRFETIDIYSTHIYPTIPRFSIIVYDYARRATRSCAVFFVPSGRETEYQFSTPGGLATIAEQAGCRRLLAVRCNKPHEFPPMAELQIELSSIAISLAPGDIGALDGEDRIPYVALNEESGWETIASGSLDQVGLYCIEESSTEECKRRLIFLENQQFVQTEVRLVVNTQNSNQKKKKSTKNNNNSNNNNNNNSNSLFQFDFSYLDDHHRTMLVSYLGTDLNLIRETYQHSSSSSSSREITKLETGINRGELLNQLNLTNDVCAPWLPNEYLHYLSTLSTNLETNLETKNDNNNNNNSVRSISIQTPRTLLIGLGGGSLAMAIQKYFPQMYLDIVELVPNLENLAKQYFGFVQSSKCRILTGDGLDVIKSMIKHNQNMLLFQYDCIIIDVDSKNVTEVISAPPKEFITTELLNNYNLLLSQRGMLSLNIITTNLNALNDLKQKLYQTFFYKDENNNSFGNLFQFNLNNKTTKNITFHITKNNKTLVNENQNNNSNNNNNNNNNNNKKKKNKGNSDVVLTSLQIEKKNKKKEFEKWFQGISMHNDPLELEDLIDKIEYINHL